VNTEYRRECFLSNKVIWAILNCRKGRICCISYLVFSFCIVLDVVCWTPTVNIHGLGGVHHNFGTLEACKAACIRNSNCVAIDWDSNNPDGQKCWILATHDTKETQTRDGTFIHYRLNRPFCTS